MYYKKISDIEKKQLKIIQFVKLYFSGKNSPFIKKNFFAFYDNNEGVQNLKSFFLGKKKNFIKLFISQIYNFIHIYKFRLIHSIKKKEYKNIIVTWGNYNSFDKKGIYYDKYLSINSNHNRSTFWFVLVDDGMPKKISENIAIIYKKKENFFSKNYFFYYFKKMLNNELFDPDNQIANNILDFLENNSNFNKIKNLLMPYEGQVFQKKIFNKIKKKNIETFGFDHSAPHSLPTQMINTLGSPKNLIVTGSSTKETYVKHLNWKMKNILISKPTRYQNFQKKNFSNTMFLPHEFDNENIILDCFKNFILKNDTYIIDKIKIKIHPIKLNVSSHQRLKKNLELIIKSQKKKKSNKKKNLTIVVGFTTAVLVALEFDNVVLHICPNPIIDAYLNCLWKDINVERLDNNSFIYKLKKKNKYLNFRNKNIINKILNNEVY